MTSEVTAGVRVLTITRPDTMNGLSNAIMDGLPASLTPAVKEPGIGWVGAPARTVSARRRGS